MFDMFRNCSLHRLPSVLVLAIVLWSVIALSPGVSVAEDVRQNRNFDARIDYNEGFTASPEGSQNQALATLRTAQSSLAVTYDAATGVTRSLSNRTTYLTGARSGEPQGIGLDFLQNHSDLLGLLPADLAGHEITDSVYSALTGATHLYLRQMHLGLPVYNGQLHININRDGRIISVNNAFLANLAAAAPPATPSPDAGLAARKAAAHLGIELTRAPQLGIAGPNPHRMTTVHVPELSLRDLEARLMWLPIRRGEARLVWNFQVHRTGGVHLFDMTVDAHDGRVWTRFDWVAADSYRVFPSPVESPDHSSSPPPEDGRVLVSNPADATASPLGWHNNGTISFTVPRGNNAHAFDDLNGTNLPPAVEPDCGESLDCDFHFPIDFGTADPVDYTSAAVTNLFYWVNFAHDVEYHYGFDEVSGNFQVNNLGNGGLGNDAVQAMSQKSGSPCPNNAFMSTPPDGVSPTQFMCLWTGSTPRRDFSWDAGVIVHEFGHGISNRLVGGPSNVSCLGNTQQPGEGLSDWWGLTLTHEAGDQGTDSRGSGTYILGQPTTGGGVRPQPYSTDPAVNSYTYETISGVSVPHGVGSVFAQVAWEAYWALIDVHGFDTDFYNALGGSGNQRMKLYLNEGLKNTACGPDFLDVRDGILQAAVDNYSGSDVCRLWQAFADFGLGTDAVSGGPNSTSSTNGVAIPPECEGMVFSDGFESGDVSAWSASVP